ncbi:MAG: ABC transporter ATP-binding protein/permease [Candidatus Omnitrophica bacterium]|nr:ABC transporter ATP-binding protein/permease [Candidatus Omnitrophota bacterium]
MSFAVDVRHLSKTFVSAGHGRQRVQALRDVSLQIRRGEIFGILGPNGAGKTTFLNILSTLLLPDAGTVTILGIPSTPQNSRRLRSFLNMSSGYPNFPWCLSVEENLRFYGRLYGLSPSALEQRIARLMKTLELEHFAKVPFDELSSGTKQKLALAKAMINDPKIIFLDEPTVGLDPHVAVKTRETILDIQGETRVTVLLTTHNMPEAEALCGRIAFIKDGRILKAASPAELKQFYNRENLEQIFIELARTRTEGLPASDAAPAPAAPEKEFAPTDEEHFLRDIALWGQRCLAFFLRNFLFGVRNIFTFMELLFWPSVSLVSVGLMGDFLQLQENALAFILTGAITAGVLQVAQLDVAYGLLYEVWSKSLKQTLLTPVGVTESLFGAWFNGILRGGVIFIALGLSAMVLFRFTFPPLGPMLIFLAGIFGCALLLGLLVNVLLLTFGQKAEITAWMFAYLFMLLSGIYYPVTTLPAFFFHVSEWIPVTYFLEYLRQYFGFTPVFTQPLFKGTALIALYLGLGLALMRFAFHRARKKGIILRLSE